MKEVKIIYRIILLLFVIFFIISLLWTFDKIKNIDNKNTIENSGNITQTVSINIPKENNNNEKININTASAEILDKCLPGIGKVLSKRIIEGRPYNSILELKKIKGISDETYGILKDKVIVK